MKREYGPTPHGGDYSEIVYLDEEGNPTDEDNAVEGAIYEYKADGTYVFDAHFLCK